VWDKAVDALAGFDRAVYLPPYNIRQLKKGSKEKRDRGLSVEKATQGETDDPTIRGGGNL